jgi:hypothetical protein
MEIMTAVIDPLGLTAGKEANQFHLISLCQVMAGK